MTRNNVQAGSLSIDNAVQAILPAPDHSEDSVKRLALPGERDAGDAEERGRTVKTLIAEWEPRLRATCAAWCLTLPAEAAIEWEKGAVYIRVSSALSLARESPDTQLTNTLELMARKRYYVSPEALFFDVESGTDIAPRAAFRRLYDAAVAGGYKAIGVFINERMFRNLEQSIQIKREFRRSGIQLVYLGMYEGDRRNPAAWQLETMQDTTAELHARNTGYYVGLTFEAASRAGRPVGKIPEVYRENGRSPSFLGRRGSILSWVASEPLASILQEGCRRYLEGASLADVARWAGTTELFGVTPKGRVMDKHWWRQALTNPRFAGYQVPSVYTGFKPGKESDPRPRRRADSELVRCLLPALWTLEDYRRILELGRERSRGRKVQPKYRSYLLSGVAIDAKCGHAMQIFQQAEGRYWMVCREVGTEGRCGKGIRVDLVAAELDALIGGLRLDDGGLRGQIEAELRAMVRNQQGESQRFKEDPGIGSLRQMLALAETTEGQDDLKVDLKRRIATLEAVDGDRRDALSQPLVQYRKAMAHFENWSVVWAGCGIAEKNELLRDIGFQIAISEGGGDKRSRQPGRAVSISTSNPMFELALGIALMDSRRDRLDRGSASEPISTIHIPIRDELTWIVDHLDGLAFAADGFDVPHSTVVGASDARTRLEALPGGPWLTVAQVAQEIGVHIVSVHKLVDAGVLPVQRLRSGKRPWIFIGRADLDFFKANQRGDHFAGASVDPYSNLHEQSRGPRLLVPQVAILLGRSAREVRQLLHSGQIPVQRIDGEDQGIYVGRRDVDAFIAREAAATLARVA